MTTLRSFVLWHVLAMACWVVVWVFQWALPLTPKQVTMHWDQYLGGAFLAFLVRYIPISPSLQRNAIIAIGALTALIEATDRSHFFWYIQVQAYPRYYLMWIVLGGLAHLALYLAASRFGLVSTRNDRDQ